MKRRRQSRPRSHRPAIAAAAGAGIRQTLTRPRAVALLLLVNLLAAWVLAAPMATLLSSELDDNLYGDEMARAVSWRWFDEVDRRHGREIGNLEGWHALFSSEGVGLDDLLATSGQLRAIALAAFFLFWINGLLHCGFLATLYPDRRGGFAAATARFAFPATLLAIGALLSYLAAYALLYVQTGRWLAGWMEAVDSEWIARAATAGRLVLTLAVVLGLKLFYDLTRVILIERNSGNWPWAGLLALRDLARHGPRYAAVYLLLGLLVPVLSWGWSWSGGRWAPQGWIGLFLLFGLHQLFLAARIGLRLSHLAATRSLYRNTRRRSPKAPFKVTRRGEAPPDEAALGPL